MLCRIMYSLSYSKDYIFCLTFVREASPICETVVLFGGYADA